MEKQKDWRNSQWGSGSSEFEKWQPKNNKFAQKYLSDVDRFAAKAPEEKKTGKGDEGTSKVANNDTPNAFYTLNGAFLGFDDKNDNKVYIANNASYDDAKSKSDFNTLRESSRELSMTHSDFKACAYVFSKEGGGSDVDEYKWFAFTASNAFKGPEKWRKKKTIAELLKTSYSTVPAKFELGVDSILWNAKLSREGLIYMLMDNDDITDGAEYWDGYDFIAWGRNRPAKAGGGVHPKLNTGIEIPKAIYDKYLSFMRSKFSSGKIKYYGEIYDFPAAVFLDPNNWSGDVFKYKEGGGKPRYLAKGNWGASIFWEDLDA